MSGRVLKLRGLLTAHFPSFGLLFTTSSSLVSTMVVASGLGAAFWWVAARSFRPEEVGIAAGAVSAMLLLGSVSVLGLGTLLIRELPRHPPDQPSLVWTASVIAGGVGALAGTLFTVLVPSFPGELGVGAGLLAIGLFASGVAVTTVAAVIDHALLGLLRTGQQLLRTVVFSVGKLALLVGLGIWAGAVTGTAIFAMWVAGAVLSLLVIGAVAAARGADLRPAFAWHLVPGLGQTALAHHFLNTALQVPTLGLPVLVAVLAPPVVTAQFYIAWMIASLSFYAPLALAQTLYAVGSRATHEVWAHARITVVASFAFGVLAVVGLAFLGGPLLSVFGETYAAASGAIVLLAAGSLPLVIKDHYHTVYRIAGRAGTAGLWCAVGAGAELAAAGIGLSVGGLVGLASAWLTVLILEAAFMGPAMYRAARQGMPHGTR